jgi:glycosyltransferase involved in cell wall biosynthesis
VRPVERQVEPMTATQPAARLDADAAPTQLDQVDAPRLAVLTRGIAGGGVQKMSLHLAGELAARGWRVDLVSRRDGARADVPEGVRVVVLPRRLGWVGRRLAWRADRDGLAVLLRPVLACAIAPEPLRYLPGLVDYLRSARPIALFSATTYLNLVALWARRLAEVETRVLVSERDSLSGNLRTGGHRRAWRWRHAPPLLARAYAWADAVVAVSDGVADDLARLTGLHRERIRTIYNPVVPDDVEARCAEPIDDPWLAPGEPPVVVSAGRLVAKKQHGVLLAAFARLRAERPVRLLILGDGPERGRIEQRARELGVADDVRLAGWCANPYPVLARAAVFALTSNREGFGNVLVEALRSGCPVVATDCPSGPSEILGGGRYGELVPVGDVEAVAAALGRQLDRPQDRAALRARGAAFTTSRAADAYLAAVGLPSRPAVAASGRRA